MSLSEADAIGVADYRFVFCYVCQSKDNVSFYAHDELEWASTLRCSNCSVSWVICRECLGVQVQYTDRTQVLRHCKDKHKRCFDQMKLQRKKRPSVVTKTARDVVLPSAGMTMASAQEEVDGFVGSCSPASSFGGTSMPEVHDVFLSSTTGHALSSAYEERLSEVSKTSPSFKFSNDSSTKFFKAQHESGMGAAYLVGFSQFHIDLTTTREEVEAEEIAYHMKIALLASKLTFSERKLLASVVDGTSKIVHKRMSEALSGHISKLKLTSLPTSTNSIRSRYVEGKFSILKNLPRPVVRCIDAHGYVSLKDCIADILAHGLELDIITVQAEQVLDVSKISESKYAREIFDRASSLYPGEKVVVLYFNEWSDDFEPLYSSKGTRGSTWLKTVTIAPPPDKLHSLCNTYPIAIGKKSANHELIERQFALEMLQLRNGEHNPFYSSTLKSNVKVYVEMFASLQDQPERRHANYVMLGGGKFTARWGHAIDFASVATGVPACKDCFHQLLQMNRTGGATPTFSCDKCLNWETNIDSGLLDFSPPKNFPESEVPLPSGMLRPLKLTYDTMKVAVVKAHNQVVCGEWTVENSKSYLWVNGLNTDAIRAILECATNVVTFASLERDKAMYPADYAAICREKSRSPCSFECWQFPAFWVRGTKLSQHIDVVMHILFLGVIKASIKRVEDWMKGCGKHDCFLSYAKGVLDVVQKLNLNWCKVLPYPSGRFGGWVSENYLALARLLPWFYAPLDEIAGDPEVYEQPVCPQWLWTAKENKLWLSKRGLAATGLADVLRHRVNHYMTQEDGPPPLLQPVGGPVSDVFMMLECLWSMTGYMMAKTVNSSHVATCEHHIKLFLSAFDRFDGKIRKSKDKPMWLSSYNYVCLLNIPEVMNEFGPLSNLWEGGGQGEKILRNVKPIMNGYHKNWQRNALNKLLDNMALNRLIEDSRKDDVTKAVDQLGEVPIGELHLYDDIPTLRQAIRKCVPISVACLEDGTFAAVLKGWKCCVPIELRDAVLSKVGLTYFKWHFAIDEPPRELWKGGSIARPCLMLPLLMPSGLPKYNSIVPYSMIDWRWQALDEKLNFSFHVIHKEVEGETE